MVTGTKNNVDNLSDTISNMLPNSVLNAARKINNDVNLAVLDTISVED